MLLRLVGVAPAVNTAAVLPPTVTAAAAAFRTSAREAWVVIPVTLSTVGSGRLDAVPIGLAVPPRVVAASPASVHPSTGAVAAAAACTPAAATPFPPTFAPGGPDRHSVILDAFFSPWFFLRPAVLTGG
jgi:hypothetical protein